MSFIGKNVIEMTDIEHFCYMENCNRLSNMLQAATDELMNYIFQGKCQNPEQWENIFKAVNQAVFLKEYLKVYCTNITAIAEDFLAQIEEWKNELATVLN
jgi:hypothetical protein